MGLRKERGPYICIKCANEYYTRRPPGEGEKYCSRGCSHANAKSINKKSCELPKYTIVYHCKCERCSSMYYAKSDRSKRCNSCGNTTIPYTKTCNWCDKEYKPTTIGSMQCSDKCKQEVKKEAARTNKARRRAIIKGSTVETVRPYKVFNRDKWICQACACDTPEKLRGTHDDNAPELDHIVPLSNGGEHSYSNTQCLCRLCNQLKGSKSMSVYMKEIINTHKG